MNNLIERNIVLNDIKYIFRKYYLKTRSENKLNFLIELCNDICEYIYKIPEVDVERHAHWIELPTYDNGIYKVYKCSSCERILIVDVDNGQTLDDYPYCHCGCKMKKEINNEKID